jgi:hypothetical protein
MCAGRAAVAVMDQVRSTAKERFANRIGTVTASELEALEESLREILGLIWSDRVNLRNLWVCFGCFRRFSRTERAAVGAVFSDD